MYYAVIHCILTKYWGQYVVLMQLIACRLSNYTDIAEIQLLDTMCNICKCHIHSTSFFTSTIQKHHAQDKIISITHKGSYATFQNSRNDLRPAELLYTAETPYNTRCGVNFHTTKQNNIERYSQHTLRSYNVNSFIQKQMYCFICLVFVKQGDVLETFSLL